ncbi:MAG: flagellar motor protein MotD [Panacagrimonas sp.]
MAKKVKHEDHLNHEAWAIPYGDLVTLLLALFVVMYSMSAINEGKFRVASDSLNAAFRGPPRSSSMIQMGPKAQGQGEGQKGKSPIVPLMRRPTLPAVTSPLGRPDSGAGLAAGRPPGEEMKTRATQVRDSRQLEKMADQVQQALGDLIARDMVIVRRHESWLEVEIRTDILFSSGAARIDIEAAAVLDRLAGVLKSFDNHLRIEGHTDDRPIATREFPSNWELSSARAASVVHRFMGQGVDPRRMTVMGLSQYQPIAGNRDENGRNRNRRVVIVVLASPEQLPQIPDGLPTQASAQNNALQATAPVFPAGAVAALAERARP